MKNACSFFQSPECIVNLKVYTLFNVQCIPALEHFYGCIQKESKDWGGKE